MTMVTSPLGAARVRRRLTVEEAAARAGLETDAVRALEENRIYRFESPQAAMTAALVYATALGVSKREARQLAGLPVRPRVFEAISLRRFVAAIGFGCALAALAWFVVVPRLEEEKPVASAQTTPATTLDAEEAVAALPQPWEIQVDVLNGTGAGSAATHMANEIAGLAYQIGSVAKADSTSYLETRVYYPPGGQAIAERLAAELRVGVAALPGGDDPRRLVVIVGADRA
jgi:hypothetical protein